MPIRLAPIRVTEFATYDQRVPSRTVFMMRECFGTKTCYEYHSCGGACIVM
jgi:hypothetical protein